MKALEQFVENINGRISDITKEIKKRVFGANNENLDFLMDSFYKLSPEQRSLVVVSAGVLGTVFVLGIFGFYFSRVDALERELNGSFNSLHELRALKGEFEAENSRYEKLIANISRKTSALRVKPFFEEKAQSLALELQGLADSTEAMAINNPLSQKMQYVKVRMGLQKVSIPRLLSFVTEIEKSNNFLAVKDMSIRSRYGTKLYFDADLEFRGYSVQGY